MHEGSAKTLSSKSEHKALLACNRLLQCGYKKNCFIAISSFMRGLLDKGTKINLTMFVTGYSVLVLGVKF